MVNMTENTEKKILDAARKIFISKGKDAARMQDIADEAGINKALLHYYFRSKDKLFQKIFEETLSKLIKEIISLLDSDKEIGEILALFSKKYIEFLIRNPFIPQFILHELHANPENLAKTFLSTGIEPPRIIKKIRTEMQKGNIRELDPREILINLIALSVFPFVAGPLMLKIFYNNDQEEYRRFLENRKNTVSDFINNAIKKHQ
jgi:TetR/AcrR family transcriptional regulator